MNIPACHSRRQLEGTDQFSLCLHPDVSTPLQVVTLDMCRACGHRLTPPPIHPRTLQEVLYAPEREEQVRESTIVGHAVPAADSRSVSVGNPGWQPCHSRAQISGQPVCRHPLVSTPRQIVSPAICRTCHLRRQPKPAEMRSRASIASLNAVSSAHTVAVVVISHNYGRYLKEALDSVLSQVRRADQIVVVDDASDDDTARVAAMFAARGVRYCRIEAANVHDARRVGMEQTQSDVLCFLDADDRLGPEYLARGMRGFRDHRVGIVHSDLSCFGAARHVIEFPQTVSARQLSVDNVIHAGSLVLRSALEISQAFDVPLDPSISRLTGDWWMWRAVLRCGWTAVKQSGRYEYRRHAESSLTRHGQGVPYYDRAWLALERLTLFVPLSGRKGLWTPMAEFLQSQSWPHDQIALLLLDTSQDAEFGRQVRQWAAASDYADVRYTRWAVGTPGLADENRQAAASAVRVSMARIYNWLRQHLMSDYVWILEDDICPPRDVCERLMRGLDATTASVAAPYRSRFHDGYVVWDQAQRTQHAAGFGLQPVGGNGFGCVVLRSDAITQQVFTADGSCPDFDHAFYQRLAVTQRLAKVDWNAECAHLPVNGHRRTPPDLEMAVPMGRNAQRCAIPQCREEMS